jgi:delta24-sterol reductase
LHRLHCEPFLPRLIKPPFYTGPKRREDFISWNRAFERKVRGLGGQKWLYAHAYYTEEEFNEIYNREEYDRIREKYHASYLPSVYDKVKVDAVVEPETLHWIPWLLAMFWSLWPLKGLFGVYMAIHGGDYLLPRKKVDFTELDVCNS